MFTVQDLDIAEKTMSSSLSSCDLYTPEKSDISYRLHCKSNLARGTSCELMIVDCMKKFGIDCDHMGGSQNRHDITLYTGGKVRRAEVKSSVLGPTSNKYYFVKVKPALFDILYLSFVTPVNGVVIKTIGKQELMAWIELYSPKNKNEKHTEKTAEYDIYFRSDMTHPKMQSVLWNPESQRMELTI